MNWAASLWLAVAFGNCILAIILATYLAHEHPEMDCGVPLSGTAPRGIQAPVEPRVSLWDRRWCTSATCCTTSRSTA